MSVRDLGTHLEHYLALRRVLGFKMVAEERVLRRLIAFLEAQGDQGPIRAQSVMDWIRASTEQCGPGAQSARLSVARGFLRSLRAVLPETEVPSHHLLPKVSRPTPHIYTSAEISALLASAQNLRSSDGLRGHTIATVIGLMVSTGIRAGEALRLRLAHVELDATVPVLQVRQTKFRKSRIVALHPSVASALNDYSLQRRRTHNDALCERFFVSRSGAALPYRTLSDNFVRLARDLDIRGPVGQRGPRLHDLRHTFAVNRLSAWYRDGEDVRARVPELSVYLGHVHSQSTYWYLTATPSLLRLAAQRFEHHVNHGADS